MVRLFFADSQGICRVASGTTASSSGSGQRRHASRVAVYRAIDALRAAGCWPGRITFCAFVASRHRTPATLRTQRSFACCSCLPSSLAPQQFLTFPNHLGPPLGHTAPTSTAQSYWLDAARILAMSVVQSALETALALPLVHKLAALFIGLPVLAIVLNVLFQVVSANGAGVGLRARRWWQIGPPVEGCVKLPQSSLLQAAGPQHLPRRSSSLCSMCSPCTADSSSCRKTRRSRPSSSTSSRGSARRRHTAWTRTLSCSRAGKSTATCSRSS